MRISFAALAASLLVVTSLVAARPASASLIGAEMTGTYQVPSLGSIYGSASWTPPNFTVGAGPETQVNVEGVTNISVDFSNTALALLLTTVLDSPTWNNAAFNGLVFTATAPLGIAGASVNAGTTMAGFDASRVSFTGNEIRIDWNGLSYSNGTAVMVDFTFVAVPEPASLVLLGFGLMAMAAVARRGRKPEAVRS